ncbi:MAG: glycosyltransferase family 2 protein [Deltaproteobacteria bacterium]|nr:glycosyltransferase family 2 protein [Deltaproteobacteria bacterium]
MVRTKVLIFVVAYNAEEHIENVLRRIPIGELPTDRYETEILVIDDSSSDKTYEIAHRMVDVLRRKLMVLKNPQNLGYGGNQKLGYTYAVENNFDYVILLHGDAQYAPEEIPALLKKVREKDYVAVFGSRMNKLSDPLGGGMPLYKYVANRFLTAVQNFVVGTKLTEYHSGYRLYAVDILRQIPFRLNSDGFDFDSEIIMQVILAGGEVTEVPIKVHYGTEVCHVNGVDYAIKILIASLQYRLQKFRIFYSRRFTCEQAQEIYEDKLGFISSHSLPLKLIESSDTVLILGQEWPHLIEPYVKKAKTVVCVSLTLKGEIKATNFFHFAADPSKISVEDLSAVLNNYTFTQVLLVDVLERFANVEKVLDVLEYVPSIVEARFVVTVPNVAFLPIRLMLLLGHFNYNIRGILDQSNKRLFTLHSIKRLLKESRFNVERIDGIPAPYPLALKENNFAANLLLRLNSFFIKISKGLFAYQIMCTGTIQPSSKALLERAMVLSRDD